MATMKNSVKLSQKIKSMTIIWSSISTPCYLSEESENTFEEIENASETDTAGMLELSDWEFETTMINMLRALMDKVDSMQKQVM